LNIAGDMTIDLWVNATSAQEICDSLDPNYNSGVAAKANSAIGWNWQLRYYGELASNCYLGFQFNDGGVGRWVTVGQDLTPNQWYRVTGVIDSNIASIYLNGVQVPGQTATLTSGISSTTAPLVIGDEGWGNNFHGIVDEFKMYDRALTPTEILTGMPQTEEAEDLTLSNGYSISVACLCSSPSNGQCVQHGGSVGTPGRISVGSFPYLDGDYEVRIKYCDEQDDEFPDDYTISVNGFAQHTWSSTVYGSAQWAEETTTITINNGDNVYVDCIKGQANTFCRVDFLEFTLI
jgi:hypothetical protein